MTDEEYRAEFDRVWPWLDKAILVFARTHDKEHIWKMLSDGDAQLWTTKNAAMVTTIEVYPTGLRELRRWLAGGDLTEIQKVELPLLEWAKAQGCQIVAISGRKGWLRALPGYREISTVMVKEIE